MRKGLGESLECLFYPKKLDISCPSPKLVIMRNIILKKQTMRLCTVLFLLMAPLSIFALNLNEPADYLNSWQRIKGEKDGGETLYHFTGKLYSYVPGEKRMELFDIEGFNISRLLPAEEGKKGFRLLAKEVVLFKDLNSGEILENWRNPFTGRTTPVIHIFNDPVNQDYEVSPEYLPYIRQILPSTDLGERIVFHQELFPYMENPMKRKEYGDFVQSDILQMGDFLQYTVGKTDLENTALAYLPVELYRTQIFPWLPFMRMGDRAGELIMVSRGKKLAGGFEALPPQIKSFVLKRKPEYIHAPDFEEQENANIWSYFKKLYDQNVERSEP